MSVKFLGNISILGDTIESIIIDAETSAEATDILSSYVYNTYNRNLKYSDYFYEGSLIIVSQLKTVSTSTIQ